MALSRMFSLVGLVDAIRFAWREGIFNSFFHFSRYCFNLVVFTFFGQSKFETVIKDNTPGFSRTIRLEKMLIFSNNCMIRDGLYLLPLPKYVPLVLQYEDIDNSSISAALKRSVVQIRGYHSLVCKAKSLKDENFDACNFKHIELLEEIWQNLIPNKPFSLKNKFWSDVGFQGSNPVTDFRGMGMLSVENLLYFVKHHNKIASSILSASLHPKYWYPFATVGINLSALTWRLLQDGALKTHFYNSFTDFPKLKNLDDVYVCIFVKFHQFWMQRLRNIMQFNFHLKTFETSLRRQLQDEGFSFTTPKSIRNDSEQMDTQ